MLFRSKKEKKVENPPKAKKESREVGEFESPKDAPEEKVVPPMQVYKPKVHFPARLVQHNLDKQFSKFLEVFKKLHINIPFADALAQMPSYAKFLKEILKNKKKLEDSKTVKLNEECSAILLNKLP